MSEAGVNEASHLVELRAIRKAFGENVVLDGIDLSIGRGEGNTELKEFVDGVFIVNYSLSRLSRRLEIREKQRSGSKPDVKVRGLEEQVA
jgi:hypothetical protein